MPASCSYPGSAARLRELEQRARDGRPLFEAPRGRAEELPDRVAYREVTTENGVRVGLRFYERTAAGVRVVPEPEARRGPRKKRALSPWDHERRERAKDPHYRRAEALRKFNAKRRDPEWRSARQEMLRELYATIEVFVHETGQVYCWEWRRRGARKKKKGAAPHVREHPDPASLWNGA